MIQKLIIRGTTTLFILLIIFIFPQGTTVAGSNSDIMQMPIIDGVISSGEYSSSKSLNGGNYQLFWEAIDSTSISIGILGKTTGWVAIGFDPSSQMLDADIIFAWVESNGTVVIFDAFSTNPTGGPHPPDTELGGSNDILDYNGSENETSTTIEFSRLFSTGDQDYDNDIPIEGDIVIIWAFGTSDSFSQYHGGARGTTTITISSAQETNSADTTTETTTSQTSTATSTAPGFQGLVLVIGLASLVLVYQRKR
ncbi:MAG: DOMON domain-containing protein [Candidatus Hodarchaeota archaeon]